MADMLSLDDCCGSSTCADDCGLPEVPQLRVTFPNLANRSCTDSPGCAGIAGSYTWNLNLGPGAGNWCTDFPSAPYGYTDCNGGSSTLFTCGSPSKSVTMFGSIHTNGDVLALVVLEIFETHDGPDLPSIVYESTPNLRLLAGCTSKPFTLTKCKTTGLGANDTCTNYPNTLAGLIL